MDEISPNVIPLTSNLEDKDPPFVNMMSWDTCPMLGDVDIPIGIILTNVNDWERHIRHLILPFLGSSLSNQFNITSRHVNLNM
jgi:hypothetical protein